MRYYAQLDNSNTVTMVVVAPASGIAEWIATMEAAFPGGTWVETCKNRSKRKNFAGEGYKYDAGRDAFIDRKPYQSFILDEQSCKWKAPKKYPTDGKKYRWNETAGDWVEITTVQART